MASVYGDLACLVQFCLLIFGAHGAHGYAAVHGHRRGHAHWDIPVHVQHCTQNAASVLQLPEKVFALRGSTFDLRVPLPEPHSGTWTIPEAVEVHLSSNTGASLSNGSVPVQFPGNGPPEVFVADVKTTPHLTGIHMSVLGWPSNISRDGSSSVLEGCTSIQQMPGALTLLPPILTLILALVTKQVIVSLLVGVWTGAALYARYDPAAGYLRLFDRYFAGAMLDPQHARVMLFTMVLGGMIAVVQKSGGSEGLGLQFAKVATSRTRGMVITCSLALCVFFDDYTSILVVGSTLKDLAAGLGISAEKLALIVHSLGVCVASTSPISSWVGVEIGYIQGQYEALGISGGPTAFIVCLQTIAMRTFPLLMIVCMFVLSAWDLDFGPLRQTEARAVSQVAARERARLPAMASMASLAAGSDSGVSLPFLPRPADDSPLPTPGSDPVTGTLGLALRSDSLGSSMHDQTDDSLPLLDSSEIYAGAVEEGRGGGEGAEAAEKREAGPPKRWYNAAIPFGSIIVMTFAGMWASGREAIEGMPAAVRPPQTLVNAFGHSDSVNALLWGAAGATLLACLLICSQRILTVQEAAAAWVAGAVEMMDPLLVLILAWALGAVLDDLQIARFLSSAMGSSLPAWCLPVITASLGYAISYITGSSMGTMGILFPISLPLANSIAGLGDAERQEVVLQCSAAILGASTFGNTCSMLADTTILTSTSCGCSVPRHIETATPVCALVAAIALVFGTLPIALAWLSGIEALLVCVAVLGLTLWGIRKYANRLKQPGFVQL